MDTTQVVWRRLGWNPKPPREVCVNLASGHDYRQGWINVDQYAPTADVRHDLFSFPWPFQAASVHSIWMSHYLEHVPHQVNGGSDGIIRTMRECHRILRVGGVLGIAVPYANSRNSLWNHLHRTEFIPETLGFLWGMKGHEPTTDEAGGPMFRLVKVRVRRRIGGPKFNTHYHVPRYLRTTMDWIGPKWEIIWIMEKTG